MKFCVPIDDIDVPEQPIVFPGFYPGRYRERWATAMECRLLYRNFARCNACGTWFLKDDQNVLTEDVVAILKPRSVRFRCATCKNGNGGPPNEFKIGRQGRARLRVACTNMELSGKERLMRIQLIRMLGLQETLP